MATAEECRQALEDLTGRLKVEASIWDILRLRKIL